MTDARKWYASAMSEVGSFSIDSTSADAGPSLWDAFTRGWRTEIGAAFALPTFPAADAGDFQGRVRSSRLFDAAMTDLTVVAPMRTSAVATENDFVRLYLVRHGAWVLDDPLRRGDHAMAPGDFFMYHVQRQGHFRTQAFTSAHIVMLPSDTIAPLLAHAGRSGRADSPELRVLIAHVGLIHEHLLQLGTAGRFAAHAALIELARGLATHRLDAVEPAFAPALVRAARRDADSRLTEPGLSPADVAKRMHVSPRTLQRAFAAGGEPLAEYIRRRRLEEARRELLTARNPLSVAETASRYQFADSTHFIRAFRRRFGATPATFARAHRARPASDPAHRVST
jgi:AraC family transcriptional activator of tynA and feaB